ncbi:hypothetical protein V5F38_04255 [Xanthobacter sp. V0B-10]|uniref:hypothetical protein n=1 Tax=Xanthobacter albus TaxID=3119929 RepID=UPI00372B7803
MTRETPRIEVVNRKGRLRVDVDGKRLPATNIAVDYTPGGLGEVTVRLPLSMVTILNEDAETDAPHVA